MAACGSITSGGLACGMHSCHCMCVFVRAYFGFYANTCHDSDGLYGVTAFCCFATQHDAICAVVHCVANIGCLP